MGSIVRFASLILFLFSLQIAFTTRSAHAQITIDSVTRASNFIKATTTTAGSTSIPVIYGGIAGLEAACIGTLSTTSLCNNCAPGALLACNQNRIHSSLILHIAFTVTGDISGVPLLTYGTTTTSPISGSVTFGTTGTMTKGQSSYVEIAWSDLCGVLTTDSACATSNTTGVIQLGLSTTGSQVSGSYSTIAVKIFGPSNASNNYDTIACTNTDQDGICDFEAYPGDEKIYVENLTPSGSYPNNDSIPFQYLRVFYSTVGFSSISYSTAENYDMTVDNDGGISPEKISGLENEVTYYFKSAMVDAAYNLAFLTDESYITTTYPNCGTNTDADCPFIATPSNVLGLLEKDMNCFITTAAYGSLMAPKVQDFRTFRNQFLVPFQWGRSMIFYYYNVGPKASRWMWEHPWSRPVVRAALWPVWLYAVVANSAGLFIANIAFVLLFSLVAYSIFVLRTRMTAVKVRRRGK